MKLPLMPLAASAADANAAYASMRANVACVFLLGNFPLCAQS